MEKRVLKLALGCIMLVSVAAGCARVRPDGEVFTAENAAEQTEAPISTEAPRTAERKPGSRRQDIPVLPPEVSAAKQADQKKQETKETEEIRQSVPEPDAGQDPPEWTSPEPEPAPKPAVKPAASPIPATGPAPEFVALPEQEAADGDVDIAYGEWSRVD